MKPVTFLLLSALLAMNLAGCGTSPPERHYSLAPESIAPPSPRNATYSIVVGPVSIPEMVDRPQMVLRVSSNRVVIADQARWAEPLKGAIVRVIAGNLEYLLPGVRVTGHVQSLTSEEDVRIVLDVQSFESIPGKEAMIEARWTIRTLPGKREISGRSVVHEPVKAGSDHEALAAAHERALATVSREIVAAVKGIVAK